MSENRSEQAPWHKNPQNTQNPQPPYQGNYGGPLAPPSAQDAAPGAPLPPHPHPHPLPAPHPGGQLPVPPPGWRSGYRAETQELGYHRLALADPKHRWWSPLVEGLIGVVIYFVLAGLASVPVLMSTLAAPGSALASGDISAALGDIQQNSLKSPAVFAFVFGSVALMFPALWLARLIMGPKPWGLVHSVTGRMRWGWLLLCAGIAALFFVVIPTSLDLLLGGSLTLAPKVEGETLIILLVLVALIVPVQAYAEELVFRGYLLQTLGRWLKHPAWAILLPAPLFMLAHTYDLWAQLSILVMATAAGFVTWRTGGLEAAIALHVVNNLIAMTFGIYGLADPFVQEGSTWVNLLSAIITQGLFVLVVLWVAKKRGLERTRTAQVWVKE